MNTVHINVGAPHIPDVTGLDTREAMRAYAGSGFYVVPVERGSKHPGSLVGSNWPAMSTREGPVIDAWAERWPGCGIALHVGRSGLVVLDIDDPAKLPEEIVKAVFPDGDLCAPVVPFQSTRSVVPGQGHAVFDAPAGRRIGNSTGSLPKGWGEVRGTNGVIILAPSEHAEPDGRYRWLTLGQVPELPEPIATKLVDVGDHQSTATDREVAEFLDAHTGASNPELLGSPIEHFRAGVASGGSRHNTMVETACWALREALAGLYPATEARDKLGREFREAKPDAHAREFDGIIAWAVGQAVDEEPDYIRTEVLNRVNGSVEDENPRPVNKKGMPLIRPELTYDASEALEHVRRAAYADVLCPDQVLHSTLDVLASYTSVKIAVDTGMRSPIQPNKATAIIGPPGTGKGAGRGTAQKILPINDAVIKTIMELETKAEAEVNDGEEPVSPPYRHPAQEHPSTGEGLVEAYFETVEEAVPRTNRTKKVKRQIDEGSCHFTSEEAQEFVTQGCKNDAIMFPVFRSLAFDDPTGQSGASVETRRKVAKSTYRAVFTLGFQPRAFFDLLNEEQISIGTPVRFDVCAASGVKLPSERVPHPGVWTKALLTAQMPEPPAVTLAEELKDEIYAYERALQEGDLDEHPLRVHRTRRIVSRACLIALLEGETHIDRRIWDIASELYEASVAAMEWLLERRKEHKAEADNVHRQQKVKDHVAQEVAAEEARDTRIADMVEAAARQIAERMRNKEQFDSTVSAAWKIPRYDTYRKPLVRHFGDAASVQRAIWEVGEEKGWLVHEDGRIHVGETDPRVD